MRIWKIIGLRVLIDWWLHHRHYKGKMIENLRDLNIIRTRLKFGIKGVSQLSERRSMTWISFPAVGHQLANVLGHQFRFIHSVTVLQWWNQLIEWHSGVRDFGQWKHLPQDDAKGPHVRLTRKDPIGQRFNGHPLDGQQTLCRLNKTMK